jgi:hypothetical protein
MYPILKNNSFALVDKYLHKLFSVEKNQIMLFEINQKEVVKKIIGFPNEKMEINGKKIKLESDEIYIIGENLNESIDSREYGPIKTTSIIGKIVINF